MGFSWRGKTSERPIEGEEPTVVSSTGFEANGGADADAHMRKLKEQHKFDPFMDIAKLDAIDSAIESGDLEKEGAIEQSLIAENSPYAEVRAAVCLSKKKIASLVVL